ncbi:hypothetical protein LCGC14_1838410, partial [marine sediment metagenome]
MRTINECYKIVLAYFISKEYEVFSIDVGNIYSLCTSIKWRDNGLSFKEKEILLDHFISQYPLSRRFKGAKPKTYFPSQDFWWDMKDKPVRIRFMKKLI